MYWPESRRTRLRRTPPANGASSRRRFGGALHGWRRPLAITLAGVAALALSAAAFVVLFDWNAARSQVERVLSSRLGREVRIGGDLDVQLRWHPRVIAHDVAVANPDWAARPHLVTASRITLELSLPALVRRELRFPSIELTAPRFALEQRGEQRTWASGRSGEGRTPVIGSLRIADGTVEFVDRDAKTAISADVASTGEGGDRDTRVRARGTYRGRPFELQAEGPSFVQLADRAAPYPLAATVRAGATRARLQGTLTGLPSPSALDLRLEFSGEDLAHLRELVGVVTPSTPPYSLRGRLRRDGARWSFEDVTGKIGDSDVTGQLAYVAEPRRHLAVTVVSERLDFDDLGPLIGAPPRTTGGEAASAEQRRDAARMKVRDEALPAKRFEAGRWQRMDVDFFLVGKQVLHPPALPIRALEATVQIRDGVMRIAPLRLRAAGGEIIGAIDLDGRTTPLSGRAELNFRRLALRELFPTVPAMRYARGIAHGRARLAGSGSSVAALLGSSDGRVSLAIDGGTMSQRVLELIGLDIAESALLLATGDREVPLHCAVADLGVRDGIATSDVLVVDTADTLIVGAGVIDLRRERLDLTVHPRPKDVSPLAVRSPLHVRGPLRNPRVTPDAASIAAKGVTAALLALVQPLLALAPFIETGPGLDSDCARLLDRAKTWSQRQGSADAASPSR